MDAAFLQLERLTKRYGRHTVVSDFSLTVDQGEFLTLLGPSGCGKTTILRLIAGLERADGGEIRLRGESVTMLAAEHRPFNTVFQSYALFPHMTLFDNVAFGLKMAGVAAAERQARVEEALALVRLEQMAQRHPHQLSGGQQQRVAIARAVVNRPAMLLLDESLSALDHKLRQQMQIELKQLQRKLGITFLFVTHDQEEALSMSDRIVVMREGRIEQSGTPREIYETPLNRFVAGFIGESNLLPATILEPIAGGYLASIEGQVWPLQSPHKLSSGARVEVLLRPEDLRIETIEEYQGEGLYLSGTIVERNYRGKTLDSLIRLASGTEITASEFFDEEDPDFDYRLNQPVAVNWVPGWEVVLIDES
ncbi:spermidine/putrescine ABC transporter ATP-binding protein PotA [Ectothiorhodospiraceae bacterium BW-2]|nr:spermidine/putrescine ABC transporter ATP-binding protein PotA [Ectothiorhodospiraceae bacterium BW-2]